MMNRKEVLLIFSVCFIFNDVKISLQTSLLKPVCVCVCVCNTF